MHKKQATAKCNGNAIWKTSPLSDSSISIQYLDNKFVSSACVFYWCSWHKPVVSHPFLWGCFFFNLYSPELPCNDLSSPQHTNTNIKGIVLIIWEELWSIIIWGLTRLKQIPWATLHYKTAKKVTGHLPLFDDTGNAFVRCHVFLRLLLTIPSLNTFYGYYLASLEVCNIGALQQHSKYQCGACFKPFTFVSVFVIRSGFTLVIP